MSSIQQLSAQTAAALRAKTNEGVLKTPIPDAVSQQPPQAGPATAPVQILQTATQVRGPQNDPTKESNKALTTEQIAENAKLAGAKTEEWDKVFEHINKVHMEALSYSGKPGCNPHMWINEVLRPLVNQIKSGNRTKELYDVVMELRCPLNPNSTDKRPYKEIAPSVKTVMLAQG